MTVEKDQMIVDLNILSPVGKIEWLLLLGEKLTPVLNDLVGGSKAFDGLFIAFDGAIKQGRRWLRAEIRDPFELMYPVYNSDGTDVADQELEHEDSRHFNDLRVVGSMLTDALLFAGRIQFERMGDLDLPQPLEGEYTDDYLANELVDRLNAASSGVTQAFDEIWEARFRPANGSNGL